MSTFGSETSFSITPLSAKRACYSPSSPSCINITTRHPRRALYIHGMPGVQTLSSLIIGIRHSTAATPFPGAVQISCTDNFLHPATSIGIRIRIDINSQARRWRQFVRVFSSLSRLCCLPVWPAEWTGHLLPHSTTHHRQQPQQRHPHHPPSLSTTPSCTAQDRPPHSTTPRHHHITRLTRLHSTDPGRHRRVSVRVACEIPTFFWTGVLRPPLSNRSAWRFFFFLPAGEAASSYGMAFAACTAACTTAGLLPFPATFCSARPVRGVGG